MLSTRNKELLPSMSHVQNKTHLNKPMVGAK